MDCHRLTAPTAFNLRSTSCGCPGYAAVMRGVAHILRCAHRSRACCRMQSRHRVGVRGRREEVDRAEEVGRCSARPSAVHGDAGGGGKHRLPARVAGCMAGGKSGNWICYAGARRRRSSASCSCRDDCWVEKYETDARRHPRRCVVAATTNECGVLAGSDWRPPPITSARYSPRPHRAGPIAMVCQALACYCADATWWEFPEAAIADEQEERQSVDGLAGHPQDRIEHGRRSYPQKRPMHCTPWPPGWISSAAIMRDWLDFPPDSRAVRRARGWATRRAASGSSR